MGIQRVLRGIVTGVFSVIPETVAPVGFFHQQEWQSLPNSRPCIPHIVFLTHWFLEVLSFLPLPARGRWASFLKFWTHPCLSSYFFLSFVLFFWHGTVWSYDIPLLGLSDPLAYNSGRLQSMSIVSSSWRKLYPRAVFPLFGWIEF